MKSTLARLWRRITQPAATELAKANALLERNIALAGHRRLFTEGHRRQVAAIKTRHGIA